jgi:16S rRNA (guanine527-N7)-methyltransferase
MKTTDPKSVKLFLMGLSSSVSDPRGFGPSLARAGVCSSADQIEKLGVYLDLLERWQSAINLVSPASLPNAVERHILDSAQLIPHLPPGAQSLVDLGSGAGFPGLVLAILRPGLEVHLVESDQKKCAFLERVSRETGACVRVCSERIEAFSGSFAVDVLTARALAPLSALLSYAQPWFSANPALTGLFLKGAGVDVEIKAAQALWSFSYGTFSSVTDAQGRILKIGGLESISRYKNP